METPRSKSHLNSHRRVRIVGKIRSLLEPEAMAASGSGSHISMTRTDGEFASITLGDQSKGKDSYKLDWCYGLDEGVSEVFSKEVKPLLPRVLKGFNACVIAYGAQGSGKTQLIQGSEESPGLALMAISEILPAVEELNGSVAVSCYEVCQDRVYDLLEPKEQEVLVMEDANRRVQLTGLSQAPIKSISDLMKYYYRGCDERKLSRKGATDVVIKSHRGLIVHVSFFDKESNKSHVGKINFVDLAGYEDTKKKNLAKPAIAEIGKVNKSLYALLNVVCALNSSDTYIPYRETKFTRLLQDCLCKASGAVVVTCLNPIAYQDTIHAVCLASRSCHVVNTHRHDSIKNKSGQRFLPASSPVSGRIKALDASVKKFDISKLGSIDNKGHETSSVMKKRPEPLSNSPKKHGNSLHGLTVKNVDELSSTTKGRVVFNLERPSINSEKENHVSGNHKDAQQSIFEENDVPIDERNNFLKASDIGSHTVKEDVFVASKLNELKEDTSIGLVPDLDNDIHDNTKDDQKQNPIFDANKRSPTISEKLREISNSLRLASSRPISVDYMEPKTPVCFRLDGNSRFEDIGTPQDILKARSTGLKKSLVKECLTFLNSANKEELKELKGIGEKRATYIIERRERTPEPFKDIDDLKTLGLSRKQIRGMMSQVLGDY